MSTQETNAQLLSMHEEDNIEDVYLTFEVKGEQYAVCIRYVTEIVGLQKIIEIPDVPHYIRGVVNLRGKVIPVMDVRLRFNMPEQNYDDRTVIIVLEVNEVPTGLVVDRVSEVLEIPSSNVEPPPQTINDKDSKVIQGMGRSDDRVFVILDVDKLLFSTGETQAVA